MPFFLRSCLASWYLCEESRLVRREHQQRAPEQESKRSAVRRNGGSEGTSRQEKPLPLAPPPPVLRALQGIDTYRALDGMHPTLRQVPPGGPRLSMQRVYESESGPSSENAAPKTRRSEGVERRHTFRPSWEALTAAT